jgi:hypothetical protein
MTVRWLLVAALTTATCFAAAAEDIVYTDGQSHVRYGSGEQTAAEIGDVLVNGDSVRTGADGLVELDKESATIRIAPGTVFTITETTDASGPRSTLSIALGSARFKFNRFVGTEPRISTMSAVAGVRGTEFSVYAGADGSSLITVDEGLVELAAAGQTVQLGAAEGVEVRPGAPPGEKFDFSAGEFDFSAWHAGREAALLGDPIGAVLQVEQQLELFIGELQALLPRLASEREKLASDRELLAGIEDAGQRTAFYEANVQPRERVAFGLAINVRFNALSALSLRRFVLGRMYMKLKAAAFIDPPAPDYDRYRAEHARVLERYEREIAPHLVVADI